MIRNGIVLGGITASGRHCAKSLVSIAEHVLKIDPLIHQLVIFTLHLRYLLEQVLYQILLVQGLVPRP